MKKIIVIFVLLVVVLGGLSIFLYSQKEAHIQNTIEKGIGDVTGLEAQISGLEILESGSLIKIKSLIINNPEGFFSSALAVVSNIELRCDLKKLVLSKTVACTSLKASVDEIYMNRNQKGAINFHEVNALKREVAKQNFDHGSSKFMIERAEIKYGRVEIIEASTAGNRKSEIQLSSPNEIYGFIADPKAFIYLPTLKIVFALNRGSLSLPRSDIQRRILEMTGKK